MRVAERHNRTRTDIVCPSTMPHALHTRGLGYGIILLSKYIVDPNSPIDSFDPVISFARMHAQGAKVRLTSGFHQLGRSSPFMRLTEHLALRLVQAMFSSSVQVRPPLRHCREVKVADRKKYDNGHAQPEHISLNSPGPDHRRQKHRSRLAQ